MSTLSPTPQRSSRLDDEVTLCIRACDLAEARVRELAGFAAEQGMPLVEALVNRGDVDEAALLRRLAADLEVTYLDAPPRIAAETLQAVPASAAMRLGVVPLSVAADGTLDVACADPFDWRQWDDLGQIVNRPLRRVLCRRAAIDACLREAYGLGADTVEHIVSEQQVTPAPETRTATDLTEEEAAKQPTVVQLVNRILLEAIQSGATDIHLEPYEQKYRVRYRIDGMLEDVSIARSIALLKIAVICRIKIMADLDITEKRLPQDGRAHVTLGGREYDLRVSVLPGTFGEAVNIRIQHRDMVTFALPALGFDETACRTIDALIDRPHGLVLVTGPTGSGKTTTLYTCLHQINRPDRKIITVEDPVEYWMEDIVQTQVQEEIGFTFARCLRSILRHDPDVILVGEIRDRETADIAIRASLTGHLVFATLHTNDAASAVTRLLDLGIEPFLLASCLSGVIAQRLVRKVCPACRRAIHTEALSDCPTHWEGKGCGPCRFTGYQGRAAIAEVLPVNAALRARVQQRVPAGELTQAAVEQGMQTLRRSAMAAVAEGVTTLAEAMRVTLEENP